MRRGGWRIGITVLACALAAGGGRAAGQPMLPPLPVPIPATPVAAPEPTGPMGPTVPPPAWLDSPPVTVAPPATLPIPSLPSPSLTPNPAGPPAPPTFYGSSSNQPFNEKAMFPTLPPVLKSAPPGAAPGGPLPTAPRLWSGNYEFGFNGSQGNTELLNVRLGFQLDRRSNDNLFHTDLSYIFNVRDRETTQNQALLNLRDEVVFAGSKWSVFTAGQVEYDEFRVYNFRSGAYTGLAYQWVKTDALLVGSRFGAGATRELATEGGAPNRWVPEALFGGDFNYRFNDRQAFLSSLDFYPNIGQLGQYRVRARAGYEIVLDPSHGMVLRLGVQDRFDSNPGPAKRNDVNFFTSLLFKF